MYTYQDLQQHEGKEGERLDFVKQSIGQYQSSDLYREAKVADEYARHRNRTILQYQKMLYTISGQTVPDNWSANYKLASNFFNRLITQQNQYLLGNGCTWEDSTTKDKLGADFDIRLQEAGKNSLIGGVSYGFFNLDHLEVFSALEFVPLYDEENGALMAGVRYWQIDSSKPLRATLYEMDGYTDYIWEKGEGRILKEKRPYITRTVYTEADGLQIYDGMNYPSFPIVPLYGNPYKQSELVGMREQIDAYDLIKSGFANDLDDVSQIFWTISNAGGMDDIDLAEFVQRLKTVKAARVEDQEQVQAHTVDLPYQARETALDRIRKDIYRDFMALDTEEIAGGAVTATQIKASYEPLNNKTDQYEYCVHEFIQGILAIAGIEDNPTFTRSMLINQGEEIQDIMSATDILDEEYLTRKILTLLGDGDQAEEILARKAADEISMGGLTEDE